MPAGSSRGVRFADTVACLQESFTTAPLHYLARTGRILELVRKCSNVLMMKLVIHAWNGPRCKADGIGRRR